MCGRYSLSRPTDVLARLFDAREARGLRGRYVPSFNIAPTREVVGLASDRDGERVLDIYRWGLVPSWARAPGGGPGLFNARSEGISSKRAFGDGLARRRLVVLADGFFEWRPPAPGQPRQPRFFQRADGAPLAFAGLWERWRDPVAGPGRPSLLSCTIITTAAGPDLEGVHDRMPVVLEPDALVPWLDPSLRDTAEVEAMLHAGPPGTLVQHGVDPRVGDVRNDDSGLVAPYQPPAPIPQVEPLRLFG